MVCPNNSRGLSLGFEISHGQLEKPKSRIKVEQYWYWVWSQQLVTQFKNLFRSTLKQDIKNSETLINKLPFPSVMNINFRCTVINLC